jgi:hypothetical protein
VFSVFTNSYGSALPGSISWRRERGNVTDPDEVLQTYQFMYKERSWWHVDRDDGVLLEHFTNIVQAVRVERNWTNYFYLCRDGANKNSNRVKEDSYYDIRQIIIWGNTNLYEFIRSDPLVYCHANRQS